MNYYLAGYGVGSLREMEVPQVVLTILIAVLGILVVKLWEARRK